MKRLKVLSLAALVAFAACDEGQEPVVAPPVTGTISGVVTIEGAARSGVTVTLSTGQTATTDAAGAYSFAGIQAGTYTVTISGFPADATFTTTTRGATITTAGQVVTVNFDGTFVRTSAILGTVAAGGRGLAGVRVALTGAVTAGATANTDANGQYAFTGLRAGTYTVTISGWDATQFSFAATTATVTVAVGQSQIASFTGTPLATSRITGTVRIDGAAAAGVKVTLSPGGTVATTDAAGAYTFANLAAGTYTVTVSDFPADAQFTTPAQAVTITAAGSTVTANFDGVFIKTSSIVGTVTVAGTPIGGVTVSLNTGASTNTDSNGQYAFSALRAGTYTVTISGWNTTLYTFATTSQSVTLAVGQSAVRSFAGAHVATARITGSLFIDESTSNGVFDTTEDRLAVAGIVIEAEGGAVGNTFTTTTDASGNYQFTGLTAGTYRISILGVTGAPLNPALPGNVAFRAGAPTLQIVSLGVGATQTVHWPFNITRQRVDVRINLTSSLTAAAGSPVTGATIRLYDTYANALANTGTVAGGMLGTGTSTSTPGVVTFRFSRALDVGPGGGVDNIVFALVQTLPANHLLLPTFSNVMEIRYAPKDSIQAAPEFFRVRNQQIVLQVRAAHIPPRDTVPLANWVAELRRGPLTADTAGAAIATAVTNAQGIATFTRTAPPSYPDTIWIRLMDNAQVGQNYPFTQIPSGTRATAVGRFLRFIWDGTIPASDTVMMGAERVRWSQANVSARVHRERDDSTGVTPTYTLGDNLTLVTSTDVRLFSVPASGSPTLLGVPVVPGALDGIVTFPGVTTQANYQFRARVTDANLRIVSDTLVAFTLDGSAQEVFVNPLAGGAGNSTFAFKARNNRVSGTIKGTDGATDATGIRVRVQAGPGNIGSTTDTTVTVGAGGAYATAFRLLEGPYTITVADSATSSGPVWSFLRTLTTTTTPVSGTHGEGAAVSNTDARTARRLAQGYGNSAIANFLPDRMDTRILGNIVNDRDVDLTVLDPSEALEGAVVRLFRDGSGAITYDTLIAEATTDSNGRYSFTGLREGRYAIRYISGGGPVSVLRAIAKDSAVVTTGPAAGTGAQPTRTVGTQTHTTGNHLPRWDYNLSLLISNPIGDPDFTFLYTNTIARGTVQTGGGVKISGMTISLRRCNVSAGATSPPTSPGPQLCTTYLGSTVNVLSDANGNFEFANLAEGVYEIKPQPTTVGAYTTSVPSSTLYLLVGNGDIENLVFTIS